MSAVAERPPPGGLAVSGHGVEVLPLASDWRGQPRLHYFSCRCGVCGEPRRTRARAHLDGGAHLSAARRARG